MNVSHLRVAYLGLGVMGYPMAGHLATRGGHRVAVYNRTKEKAQRFVTQFNAQAASTPREAVSEADVVFSCVGDDADLRAITLESDGAFAGMKKAPSSSTTPPPRRRWRVNSTRWRRTMGLAL